MFTRLWLGICRMLWSQKSGEDSGCVLEVCHIVVASAWGDHLGQIVN